MLTYADHEQPITTAVSLLAEWCFDVKKTIWSSTHTWLLQLFCLIIPMTLGEVQGDVNVTDTYYQQFPQFLVLNTDHFGK